MNDAERFPLEHLELLESIVRDVVRVRGLLSQHLVDHRDTVREVLALVQGRLEGLLGEPAAEGLSHG